MQKNKTYFFIALLGIFFFPFIVDAKTSKECNYYVNENQLSGSGGGTISCTFTIGDPFWIVFGEGAFSYRCKYDNGSEGDMTITIGNDTSKEGTGFNLEDWFRENESCPRYLVFNSQNLSSSGSTYAANTDKQVDLIRDKYGTTFTPYLETSIRDEEIENDPDSEAAQACASSKEALDAALALLQTNRDKLIEMNCQNYALSDEERDTVANSENIKWGRECKQITDNYGITVSNARSALNDYTKSGCIDEDSDEYKEYENIINNLEDEVDDIDTNIDRQNGVSEGDWQFLGEDPEFGSTEIGCDSLFDTTTPGAFGWILKTILNYVKVIGPILVVLLSAIDFIKAVIGTDEKAMKEAQNKLIIRLVAAVALFLVPTLVQLLLSFINQTYCAI